MSSRPFITIDLAAALALLVSFAVTPAWSAPADPQPPQAVIEAIAAAPSPDTPAEIVVGAYINDIQELSLIHI